MEKVILFVAIILIGFAVYLYLCPGQFDGYVNRFIEWFTAPPARATVTPASEPNTGIPLHSTLPPTAGAVVNDCELQFITCKAIIKDNYGLDVEVVGREGLGYSIKVPNAPFPYSMRTFSVPCLDGTLVLPNELKSYVNC